MPRKKIVRESKAPPLAFQKQEIIRCGRDPLYFINNYVFIQHPKRGKLPFKTFDYQDNVVEQFEGDKNVITNKSRQLGLSTVCAAYALWLILFKRNKNVLVIATKLSIAQNFMNKVFYAYDELPSWLVMSKDNRRTKTELGLGNGSNVKAIPTSPDAGRSEALSLLIVDECAHIADMDDIWVGLQPTLSTGGKAILISSPNGVGNTFHRIWVDAIEGKNDFVPIELPWTVHPERDQEWYDRESANIRAGKGERGVQQEFHCSFNASGDTFVKTEYLNIIEAGISDPIAKHEEWEDCWIWKYPESGHKYLIAADVSRGNAGDFSTFHVFDTTSDEVVCEYKGKVYPDVLAKILMDVGYKYCTALICPELNTYGAHTATVLKSNNYPNLYYEKDHKNIFMAYMDQETKGTGELPGWTSGPKSRDEVVAKLGGVLRNQVIRLPSKRLLNELKTFVWKNNKAQAMKGYNDDLVMALAIGVNLYENSGRQQYSQEEIAKGLIAGMSVNSSKLGVGISDWGVKQQVQSGPLFHGGKSTTSPNNNPYLPVQKPTPFQGGQNVQDHSQPFWRQWDWVSRD